jgi:hypothetical protein
MTFKDLHLNRTYVQIKEFANFIGELLNDKRLRSHIYLITISCGLIGISSYIYLLQHDRLNTAVVKLASHTKEILRRISVKQQQAHVPQFETSMKSLGAYHAPLSGEACLSHITYCFLQKNKPQIDITLLKQEVEPAFTVQSFNIKFKSSFDYEIFDMLEYVSSQPNKFGYTRLREFEIEQLFETSPIVKGHVVYDQMSLTP